MRTPSLNPVCTGCSLAQTAERLKTREVTCALLSRVIACRQRTYLSSNYIVRGLDDAKFEVAGDPVSPQTGSAPAALCGLSAGRGAVSGERRRQGPGRRGLITDRRQCRSRSNRNSAQRHAPRTATHATTRYVPSGSVRGTRVYRI